MGVRNYRGVYYGLGLGLGLGLGAEPHEGNLARLSVLLIPKLCSFCSLDFVFYYASLLNVCYTVPCVLKFSGLDSQGALLCGQVKDETINCLKHHFKIH